MKQNLQVFKTKNQKSIFQKLFFSAILLTTAAKFQSQIVYVDIPDGVPSAIDFNSDGNPEFDIDYTGTGIMYYNYSQANNIHAIDANNWDVPACVDLNFPINASNNWDGFGDASIDGWGAGNPTLPDNTDKYLAVKFNLTNVAGGNLYYGWIRISRSPSGDITYKDYAYNSVPNAPILAGEKNSLATNEVKISNVSIYPNPVQDLLFISKDGKSENEIFSFSVLNFVGQKVLSGEVKGSIDLSSLSKGSYFVEFFDKKGNKVSSKQIIKK